tara:strand:- start:101 stop:667 length:567 start_codon:yes stop_codon:yes gene_type:complete
MSEVVTSLIKSRAGREYLGNTGGIIQVQGSVYTSTFTTSRGAWQNVVRVEIIKKNSNSNLFVVGTFGMLSMNTNHNQGEWCLNRDGSPIFHGNPLGNEIGSTTTRNQICTGKIVTTNTVGNSSFTRNTNSQGVRFLDTDTQGLKNVAYTLAVRDGNYDGTIYVNRNVAGFDNQSTVGSTNIIVMEVVA